MAGEHGLMVSFGALLVEEEHHAFQEEEGSLFEQAAGALHRGGFLGQGQFSGAGDMDDRLSFFGDGGLGAGGQGQGMGSHVVGPALDFPGLGRFSGAGHDDEQVPGLEAGGDGFPHHVDGEAQVHEAHQETPEDEAGAPGGAAEDAGGGGDFPEQG